MPQPERHLLADMLGRKTVVPKGTADIAMERLFPSKRSEVPIDEERRTVVYAILLEVGAFDLEGMANVSDQNNEERIGEGTHSAEGEASTVGSKH